MKNLIAYFVVIPVEASAAVIAAAFVLAVAITVFIALTCMPARAAETAPPERSTLMFGMSGAPGPPGAATGARFALLPPDNATGNFTKVVQRVPVRVRLKDVQTGGYPAEQYLVKAPAAEQRPHLRYRRGQVDQAESRHRTAEEVIRDHDVQERHDVREIVAFPIR